MDIRKNKKFFHKKIKPFVFKVTASAIVTLNAETAMAVSEHRVEFVDLSVLPENKNGISLSLSLLHLHIAFQYLLPNKIMRSLRDNI